MAKKYRVIGQKNLSQRIPNVNTFESNNSASLFDMGTFKLTTNLVPAAIRNYETRLVTKSTLTTLEDLRIKSLSQAELVDTFSSRIVINSDKANLNSYACFGSLKELLRSSLDNIINHWPGSLYVDATLLNAATLNPTIYPTVYNYTYSSGADIATFQIHTEFIVNNFGVNYNSSITTPDSKNLVTNFDDYSLEYEGNLFNIVSFTGIPGASQLTMLSFSVEGDVFADRPLNPNGTGGTWTLARTFHLRPNLQQSETFYRNLSNLEGYLLNRESLTPKTALFKFPMENEDGGIEFTEINATWPTTDRYNINFIGSGFENYRNTLLSIGSVYDELKTNLIIRQLIPSSYLNLDQTNSRKGEKLLAVYGRQFDEIKAFIDGLVYVNTVTYNKVNNAPDAIIQNLARTLGWDVFPIFEEKDLLDSLFNASGTDESSTLTPSEINIELWRRILVNTTWLLKSKGTRQVIESIFSMIGAPDALIEFNEHVYLSERRVNLVDSILPQFQFNDLSRVVTDDAVDLYPQNTPGIIFQSTEENEFIRQFKQNGFSLKKVVDNKKSWMAEDDVVRTESLYETSYAQGEQKTVINTKEVGISFNIAKAINYAAYQTAHITSEFANTTFLQFVSKAYERHVSATNRKTVRNKYPTLLALYRQYAQLDPTNTLTPQRILQLVEKIDTSWNRFFNQLLPATTIVNERGATVANSLFAAQKYNYWRGIDAGSIFASKQPIQLDDSIYVYELLTAVDEELLAESTPMLIEADVNYSLQGNLISDGFNLLIDRLPACKRAHGLTESFPPFLFIAAGTGKFTSGMSEDISYDDDSPVYSLTTNAAKAITFIFTMNGDYLRVVNDPTARYGYQLYKLTYTGGIYRTSLVHDQLFPTGSLDPTVNPTGVLAAYIDNSYLEDDSQYIVVGYYTLAIGLSRSPVVRSLPLNASDDYALNGYPAFFSTSNKFYNRAVTPAPMLISTAKTPTESNILSKTFRSAYDAAFAAVKDPSQVFVTQPGQSISPIESHIQEIRITATNTPFFTLEFNPVGAITVLLNGAVLTANTHYAKITTSSAPINNLTYSLLVNTAPGDLLKVYYTTGYQSVVLRTDTFTIAQSGVAQYIVTVGGNNYTMFTLNNAPQLNSVYASVGNTSLTPALQLDSNPSNIYLPVASAFVPGAVLTISYIQQITSSVDTIYVGNAASFDLNWSIDAPLPADGTGSFTIAFSPATDGSNNSIVPNFSTISHSATAAYVPSQAQFTKNFNFTALAASLLPGKTYYVRVSSTKQFTLFGTGGTIPYTSTGKVYKIMMPGGITIIT